MPSIRHTVVTSYIHHFVRRRYIEDDAVFAADLLAGRRKERPQPPASLKNRITVDSKAGFETWTLRASKPSSDLRLVYLHGGSYVSDMTPQHWGLVRYLSDATGATVVVPHYPLAPESTWRESHEPLLQLIDDGSANHTVVAGDSAGGGLGLALAQQLAARGTHLKGLILIAPWVDLLIGPEFGVVTDDPWLDVRIGHSTGRFWAGEDDMTRPELSPLFGEMAGLPPTLVVTGTRDILHPQNLELVRRLEEAAVPTELIVGEGLIHAYPILPVPEAKAARRAMAGLLTSVSTKI